jgi:putative transposase
MPHNETTFGQRVRLRVEERRLLYDVQRDGQVDALTARRARILELLANGMRQSEVAGATGAGVATVGRTRRRFLEDGLEIALWGYKAPGARPLLDEKQKTRLVALACTTPPEGRAKWTTGLLAQQAVKVGIVASIGRETVRLTLHERGIKPWREKNVVRAGAQ